MAKTPTYRSSADAAGWGAHGLRCSWLLEHPMLGTRVRADVIGTLGNPLLDWLPTESEAILDGAVERMVATLMFVESTESLESSSQ